MKELGMLGLIVMAGIGAILLHAPAFEYHLPGLALYGMSFFMLGRYIR